ncbi:MULTISPECIES: diguanylate cyclase [Psychrilyobacter]|uniref:Diguanylate cyclase n=1 Tax=Psychrilyobacter piezotolerans TaxID=2293438 RepID=A0ABX9KLI0_9FUSO|nr:MULTISPECIES: diguanylate cyclase [Psychrilyobacter]MCS5421502.1 diguanylate cyclase [Psychrilyobacter sp. S5]NDI76522.1 diguanylate cyclase [Psychrilyobacter piezotolerans]RDE66113.1 GGDEF domain-containing protein [Psychrilyobacter sp. S5]REI43291.1 diguanylate cyclase [Psychrilyobacter piezotolerans]
MNIQKSVIKISVISCLIPIFFLGMYSFFLTQNETERREQEKIEFIFASEKKQLKLINDKMEAVLNLLEFFVIHSVEESSHKDKFEDLIEGMMDHIVTDNKEVENIFYGDEFGNFSLKGSGFIPEGYDPRRRPWYTGAVKEDSDYHTTDIYRFSNGESGITIAKVVYIQDKILGVVGVDLNFSDYQLKMSHLSIGKTGKMFIMDKKGMLVVDAGIPGVNDKNIILIKEYMDLKFKGEKSYLDEILSLKKPVIFDLDTPNGEKYFRLEPILELGLIMVGGTYKNELKELPLNIIKAGIIISLIGTIISLLIINSFSKKLKVHLKNLSILIEGISNGNYSKNIEEILMYISDDSELNVITKEVKNIQKNVKKREIELKEIARIDSLTGVYNRQSLTTFLEDEIIKKKMFQSTFSIIMIDLDNFKNINDVYGHVFGDFVLKEVCKIFMEETSKMDKVCRYGGEEFIIVLPNTNRMDAFKVGERLRKEIKKREFFNSREKIKVTISGGVMEYEEGLSVEGLIEIVDKSLYKAKRSGKNKILY